MKTVALIVFAAVVTAAGYADPASDIDCSQPQKAQQLINHCSSEHFREADAALAALVEKIRTAMPDDADRDRLTASEQAWLTYRSAQCALEVPPTRRGSMSSMMYTSCARALTEARMAQLQDFLDCHVTWQEGKCRR